MNRYNVIGGVMLILFGIGVILTLACVMGLFEIIKILLVSSLVTVWILVSVFLICKNSEGK